MTNLIAEGKELIRKRQKLIRIAEKSADGWGVVDEHITGELASSSEDEKRLKKAKNAANSKRRQATQALHGPDKRIKASPSSADHDQQLFRGEFRFVFCASTNIPCFCCVFYLGYFRVDIRSTHASLYLFWGYFLRLLPTFKGRKNRFFFYLTKLKSAILPNVN